MLPPGYRLRVTRHARQRMEERGISLEEVVETLEDPVQLLYDEARDVYLALGPTGRVAVVYAARGLDVEVVTVLRRREYEALVGRLGARRYKVIQ